MAAPAILQLLNAFLHRYHGLSVVVNWMVWSFVLVCIAPIGLPLYAFHCVHELLFVRYNDDDDPKTKKNQGLLITGCDTGFGHALAVAAAKAGYTVFAGCLDPTTTCASMEGMVTAIPMDVTKDQQVDAAIQVVEEWINKEEGRYLYALVNNAGVGRGDPIDWTVMKDFEFCMDGAFMIDSFHL